MCACRLIVIQITEWGEDAPSVLHSSPLSFYHPSLVSPPPPPSLSPSISTFPPPYFLLLLIIILLSLLSLLHLPQICSFTSSILLPFLLFVPLGVFLIFFKSVSLFIFFLYKNSFSSLLIFSPPSPFLFSSTFLVSFSPSVTKHFFFFYSVRCLKKKFHPSSFSPLPSQLLLFIPLFSLHIDLLPVCLCLPHISLQPPSVILHLSLFLLVFPRLLFFFLSSSNTHKRRERTWLLLPSTTGLSYSLYFSISSSK